MTAIKIRKAEKKDVSDLLYLIRELAEFEHGLNEVSVTEEDLLKDGFGDEKLFECLVAEKQNQILGAAFYYFTYSTWNGKCLYLEDLIVKQETRSNGVGMLLMTEVIKIAKENMVKRMAWQVLDWNMDAQDFYKKIGASLDSEWLNGRMNERQINAFLAK